MNERYVRSCIIHPSLRDLIHMEIPDHKHASVNKFTRVLIYDETSIGTWAERHVAGPKKVIWNSCACTAMQTAFGARAR